MTKETPILHLICGKAASGKSTLATSLGQKPHTVLIVEDVWLTALFGTEMLSLSDYARCSEKLRSVIGPHVTALLKAGLSVVLDFPANTVATRTWMRGIFEHANADHQLNFLDVSDEVCKARLRVRNVSGKHPFSVTEKQFEQLAKHFVLPSEDEGFNILVQRLDD